MNASNWIIMLIWTMVTVGADVYVGRYYWDQHKSANYLETNGLVTVNRQVIESRTSKSGHSYHSTNFVLQYTYQVGDRTYVGTRYRYSFLSPQWNANAFPTGATVSVFYNPDKPGEAVLSRGVNATDNHVMEFVAACNLLLPIGWLVALRSKAKKSVKESEEMRIQRDRL